MRLVEVCLEIGQFRLGPLSAEIRAGECWGVVGPSGSGKTKLLEAIAGLQPLRSGQIWLDGREMTNAPPEARDIGWVPQEALLFPHLSVRDNLTFARAPESLCGGARARELGRRLEIDSLLDRSVASLSGGEQQRVALARALYRQPRRLLLDEPFAAVNPELRAIGEALLNEMRAGGVTILRTAHTSAALGACDGLITLDDKREGRG